MTESGAFALPHVAVLLSEAVRALSVQPAGIYVDGTFGRGGHSLAILRELGPQGRLLAFDRDPEACAAARQLMGADSRFEIIPQRFSQLQTELGARGIRLVDGILLDLGVSSPQIDAAGRGFSFRLDGPLDMRMNPEAGISAAVWLSRATQEAIARVLRDYGEERFARRIARAIVAERESAPITTTSRLARIVAAAVPTREPGQDPATRTFQALRLEVNGELGELELVLPQAVHCLRPGGRLAVISFHSLEDRRVKHYFRSQSQPPELPRGFAVREAERPAPRLRRIGAATRPTAAELALNPRSRSAVLRVAERCPSLEWEQVA